MNWEFSWVEIRKYLLAHQSFGRIVFHRSCTVNSIAIWLNYVLGELGFSSKPFKLNSILGELCFSPIVFGVNCSTATLAQLYLGLRRIETQLNCVLGQLCLIWVAVSVQMGFRWTVLLAQSRRAGMWSSSIAFWLHCVLGELELGWNMLRLNLVLSESCFSSIVFWLRWVMF